MNAFIASLPPSPSTNHELRLVQVGSGGDYDFINLIDWPDARKRVNDGATRKKGEGEGRGAGGGMGKEMEKEDKETEREERVRYREKKV